MPPLSRITLTIVFMAMGVSLFAQTYVWDDALGTPRNGSCLVSYESGSLTISQTVPYSPDTDWSIVADNLDMGFRSSGQTWIRVPEITLVNNTTVSIYITYTRNTTQRNRTAYLGEEGRSIEILQSASPSEPDPEPDPDPDPDPSDPDDDDYPDPEEFPGRPPIPEMSKPSDGTAVDPSHNYIMVELPDSGVIQKTVTYYDGLGLPEQRRLINYRYGTNSSDLIYLYGHDVFGREMKSYLPYSMDGGWGEYDAEGLENQYYYYCDRFSESEALTAYKFTGYEPYADGRQIRTAMPGAVLSQHPTDIRYFTNEANDVEIVDVNAENGSAQISGYYPAGSLMSAVTTDGDGRVSKVWKDSDDRVVCTEYGKDDECSRTLYGYDFRGNLCWVIMPEGYARLMSGLEDGVQSGEISIDGEFADRYCYRYRYDSHGRMTAKYRPGAGVILMAYDRAGNLLFLQDENLRPEANWLTYEYDKLGRMTRMGIALDESGIEWTAELPELDTDILIEMRENSVVSLRELTYDFHPKTMNTRLKFEEVEGIVENKFHNADVRGHLAYELVYTTDRRQNVKRAYHYDRYGNVMQVSELRPEGVLRTSYKYDLQKRLLKRLDAFAYNGQEDSPDVFLQEFTYDGSGRLESEICSLNGYAAVTEYGYDELGRLTTKTHRDPTAGEIAKYGYSQTARGLNVKERYAYNMQGWETGHEVESTQYGRYYGDNHVYYDDTHKGIELTPSYTGNVSMTSFSRGGDTKTSYNSYTYDSQDRFSGMHEYADSSSSQDAQILTDGHVEKDIRYDLNGNILSMVRVNGAAPDTLQFEYEGNRRKDFEYDANGNVTKDNVSFVDAEYNILNLPARLYDFGGSDYWVTVTYLADGTKLSSIQDEYWNGRYYAGPFVYATNDMMDGELLHAAFSHGRIMKTEDGYHDVIYIRDMLGSTRAEILDKQSAYRTFDYLPFGELTSGSTDLTKMNNDNLFTGKEFQSEFGVSWYDSQARWLTTHGIFTSQDPLGESTPSVSPYAYCANNPVNLMDPDGLAWKTTFKKDLDGNSIPTGYEWIDESQSYDSNGNLFEGLYHQAIFFSDNNNYDESKGFNIGSSTATVYCADGSVLTFRACTRPSSSLKFATVPEGNYDAVVGIHRGSKSSYTALRLSDVGSIDGKIELYGPNPSDPTRTFAKGINIHKPGINNFTGISRNGAAISMGCLLIDRSDWERFISLFNNETQHKNIIGVSVSRSFAEPVNRDMFEIKFNYGQSIFIY